LKVTPQRETRLSESAGKHGDISIYEGRELKKLKAHWELVVYIERPDTAQQTGAPTTTTHITLDGDFADLVRLF
jgi:hypothetical protein